ncbi:LOW QUALITY PROTEIN: hypothetical protein CVT26_010269 [Gymnopilus dilepis]|uniref:Uncharacterized protein n=1 Tax=Gymnopilus dilepis TaxID=231916 RepID=A0A409Y133_9AGAR|nr:LOW QUALITY PROTEIN: hypothetical protein CVT26_010269 [Gymnopilus dilepis]
MRWGHKCGQRLKGEQDAEGCFVLALPFPFPFQDLGLEKQKILVRKDYIRIYDAVKEWETCSIEDMASSSSVVVTRQPGIDTQRQLGYGKPMIRQTPGGQYALVAGVRRSQAHPWASPTLRHIPLCRGSKTRMDFGRRMFKGCPGLKGVVGVLFKFETFCLLVPGEGIIFDAVSIVAPSGEVGPSCEAALEGSIRLGLKPIEFEAIGWDASRSPFSIATAEDLHMRVHLMLTGKSVYWANILKDT